MAKRYDPIMCMMVDEPDKAQDAEKLHYYQHSYTKKWYVVSPDGKVFKEFNTEAEAKNYVNGKAKDSKTIDKLVKVPDNKLKDFEASLRSAGFKVVSKSDRGRSTHYQVEVNSSKKFSDKAELREWAEKIDAVCDKMDSVAPTTWNIGLTSDGKITAGLDVREMYVKDSAKAKDESEKYAVIMKNSSGKEQYTQGWDLGSIRNWIKDNEKRGYRVTWKNFDSKTIAKAKDSNALEEAIKTTDAEGERWITMRGSHVKIDGEGNAVAGNERVKNIINSRKAGASKESSASENNKQNANKSKADAEKAKKVDNVMKKYGERHSYSPALRDMLSLSVDIGKKYDEDGIIDDDDINQYKQKYDKLLDMHMDYEISKTTMNKINTDLVKVLKDYDFDKYLLKSFGWAYTGRDSMPALDKAIKVCDASTGHKVVVFVENYLRSIGKNNSTGKYDRIVQGVRSLLSQSLLDDEGLKKAAEHEADRLLKKYNL